MTTPAKRNNTPTARGIRMLKLIERAYKSSFKKPVEKRTQLEIAARIIAAATFRRESKKS